MGRGHLTNDIRPCAHSRYSSSPASSPSPSPSPSSSPLVALAPSSPPGSAGSSSNNQAVASSHGGNNKQLVATFKLPKTCTACGKAIKTQGKVCAKCKMRKYRERKKEQEQSLKTQMKQYREQEETLKNRIRQLEEEIRRRNEQAGSTARSSSLAHIMVKSEPLGEIMRGVPGSAGPLESSHEKLLAQQQEVLKQQQEIISVQQSVIAQQQNIINQHNLGHLTTAHLQQQRRFLVDQSGLSASAAVAVLAALGEAKTPSFSSSSPSPATQRASLPARVQPKRLGSPFAHYGMPLAAHAHQSLLQLTKVATLEASEDLHEREAATAAQEVDRATMMAGATDSAPSSPNDNRMAITHLLAPTEMCTVSSSS